MAGVKGRTGGHNIKRPEAKLGRPNYAKDVHPGFDRIDASGMAEPVVPTPGDWGLAANQFWVAALESPHHIFAESIDYANLWLLCDVIDECSKNGYRAGQLAIVHAMMSDWGATEIQRRQAKILIDRTPPAAELAPVSQLDDARRLLG